MERSAATVPVRLSNGVVIHVETTPVRGKEEDVADRGPLEASDFAELMNAVEGIASSVADTMDKLRPKEASVEFGLELAVETGKLTALLVKGSTKGNLKITLTWSRDVPPR